MDDNWQDNPKLADIDKNKLDMLQPMVPAIKRAIGKKQMFYVFLSVAILGMALLYIISVVPVLKTQIWLVFVAQFIKSTGVIIATGYICVLSTGTTEIIYSNAIPNIATERNT